MQATDWFHNLFEELKQRRVIRVATLYVVALWPLIQIVDILSPALGLPGSSMRFLLFIFVGGFPIALILAWAFDLNTSGVTRHTDDDSGDEKQALIGRNTEFVIVGTLLVVVIVLFVVQTNITPSADSSIAVSSDTSPVSSAGQVNSAQGDIQSIAVLPFAIFSQDRQDEFFADGLTEELLNVLSRVRNLRVAARTSSFAYKGVSKNIQIIGKELNVSTILEGSVRRNDVDDTVRVTAQLIDVATGSHLWSQTYDKEFRDIFKIQDEITASVVSHLRITLLGDESDKMKSRASASPEAIVAHSMGRTELAKRTKTALLDATRFFHKAIELDANYADAYSGLADAYTLLLGYGDTSIEAHLVRAQEAVDKAMGMDSGLGSAWASQGLIYMQEGRKEEARAALKKAMELNPSYAMAYMWYGNLADDKQVRNELHRKAFELDPRSPVAGFNVANNLIEAGREAEAMDIFSRIVEADPYYPGAYKLVAGINEYNGRLDEAILQHKKVYNLEENSESASRIAKLYIDLGDFDHADIWLDAANRLVAESGRAELTWLTIASHVARSDRDKANVMLKTMMTESSTNTAQLYDAAYAAFLLGDFPATTNYFESAQEQDDNPGMKAMQGRKTDATIGAAFAYRQLDQDEKSRTLLQRVDTDLDALIKDSVRLDPSTWYQKAEIAAIQGNQQMSLIHLQRAVDQGWRQHWRPLIDPAFAGILEDLNFQSMMAGLEARMNLMREQLAFEESFRDNWQG